MNVAGEDADLPWHGRSHAVQPELLAAFAELKASVALAIVRAKAWGAWAGDQDVSYDEVRASALHAVRELGLNVHEAELSAVVRDVAAACGTSPL